MGKRFTKKVLAVVVALGISSASITMGASAANAATPSCAKGVYPGAICLYDGDNYSGTVKNIKIGASYVDGYKIDLYAFRDKANSVFDNDPGNNWDLYNERSGAFPDTRIARVPINGSIGVLSTRNVVDYIKVY